MTRGEAGQIFLRQLKELNRRPQTPAMFCVGRVLEIFLKMHERTGSLDQALEKIIIVAIAVQPNLFQNVVRLVVAMLIPAPKERAVKRMIRHLAGRSRLRQAGYGGRVDILAFEVANEL